MIRHAWCSAALLLGAAAIAGAAEWRFDPALSLAVERNSNVLLVDGAPEAGTVFSLGLDLAATRSAERTTWQLAYTPEWEQYQDEQFSEFDHVAHAASAMLGWRATMRTTWDLRAGLTRRERGSLAFDAVTSDLVALPRTRFQTLSVGIDGRLEQNPRLRWRWGAALTDTTYSENEIFFDLNGDGTAEPEPLIVDDSSDLGLHAGAEGDLSQRSHLRGELRFDRIDEGSRGERDVRRALIGWTLGSAERLQFEATAGAAFTKLRDRGDGSTTLADSATDPVASLALRGRIGGRGALAVGLARDVTNTAGTAGASLADSAFVSYGQPIGRFSELSISARWADREPLDETSAAVATETRAARAEYRAAWGPHWAAVIGAEWVDQSAPAGGALAVDYQVFSVGLRWTPLARRG